MPTNKLILAPYLALAGLVIAVSAVAVARAIMRIEKEEG
jgi:CHASE1-domain containing sensor protein